MKGSLIVIKVKSSNATLKQMVKSGLLSEEKRVVFRDAHRNIEFVPSQALEPNDEQKIALEKVYAVMSRENKSGKGAGDFLCAY